MEGSFYTICLYSRDVPRETAHGGGKSARGALARGAPGRTTLCSPPGRERTRARDAHAHTPSQITSCKLSRDTLEVGCSPQVAPTPNGSFVQLAKLRSHRELRGAELYESPLPACCITTFEIRPRLHHPTGRNIPWFAGVRFPCCIESPSVSSHTKTAMAPEHAPRHTETPASGSDKGSLPRQMGSPGTHETPPPNTHTHAHTHTHTDRHTHTHTLTHTHRHVVSVDGHLDQNTCDYSSNCPFQVCCAALQEHAAPGTRSLTMLLFIQYLYLACNCCDEHPDRFSDWRVSR